MQKYTKKAESTKLSVPFLFLENNTPQNERRSGEYMMCRCLFLRHGDGESGHDDGNH